MNKYLFNQSQFNAPSVSLENGRFKVLLFSGTETLLGELNPDLCEVVESEVLQKDSTLDLSYPLNDDGYTLLKTAFSIAIPDMDYGWNVYDIVRMEEDLVGGLVKVYAENRFLELMTEPIITGSFASTTPSDALPVILDGTRWGLRYVNITNQRTFDLVDMNPLKALRYCESDYDGYLKFTASIDDFGINGFFVDFLSRLGTVSGLEFDLSHNMDGITITTDKSGIVTAMYGRGQSQNLDPDAETEEKLTFEDVLWDTGAGSPADKPVGQDWVGDETAKALYGKPDGAGGRKHIFGIHESQATTDSSLLQETWEVLQRNNAPKVNVEAKVVDLERVTGFAHEKVRLGDTVKVKVPEFNQYLETEVISIKRDRMAPEKTVLEFGNFRNSLTDTVQSLSEKTNSLYGRQAIYDRAGVIKKEIVEAEIVYSIDGVLIGENAKFSGTVEAADIISSDIQGSDITGGTLELTGSDSIFPFTVDDSIDDGHAEWGSRSARIWNAAGTQLVILLSRISDVGNLYLYNRSDPTYDISASCGSGIVTSRDFYARNNVSALTFTDRTPFYDGDAIAEIKKIKGKNGEIDHSTLPKCAHKKIKIKKEDGTVVAEEEGRDLGAMISVLTVAVQQLTARLERLEKNGKG